MTLNPIKAVDHVVAAALLYAARNRLNAKRFVASELRRAAAEYDGRAGEVVASMKEGEGHG